MEQLRQHCTLRGLKYFTRKTVETSPCAACGHEGKRAHACPVIRQVALTQALHDGDMKSQDLVDSSPYSLHAYLAIQKCRQSDSAGGRPDKADFQPARDAAGGGPQCAHCGEVSDGPTAFKMIRCLIQPFVKKVGKGWGQLGTYQNPVLSMSWASDQMLETCLD